MDAFTHKFVGISTQDDVIRTMVEALAIVA